MIVERPRTVFEALQIELVVLRMIVERPRTVFETLQIELVVLRMIVERPRTAFETLHMKLVSYELEVSCQLLEVEVDYQSLNISFSRVFQKAATFLT